MKPSVLLEVVENFMPFVPYPVKGEAADCDLCGSSEKILICEYDRRLKRLTTVACKSCGLMRTDPMPTEAELAHYYSEVYRWDYQLAGSGPPRRHMSIKTRDAEQRLSLLAPVMRPGMRILDFGSGAGAFLGAAAAAGHSVLGIEPGRAFGNYARETFGVEVIVEHWERVNQKLGPFDLITTTQVVEHLRRPVAALRWLTSLLAPDGVLYVTVPNLLRNPKQPFRRFHFAHVHGFTPDVLERAGAACGLTPDPRVPPDGTKIVFRKSPQGPQVPSPDWNYGEQVKSLFPQTSVAGFVLSGEWLLAAGRRLRNAINNSRRPVN